MKRLHSVFTEDMDHCYFSGTAPVERHHIFGGSNRKRSEEYGYVIPLSPYLHPNGAQATEQGRKLDLVLKQMAQEHFEQNHGSREDFRRIFGKSFI